MTRKKAKKKMIIIRLIVLFIIFIALFIGIKSYLNRNIDIPVEVNEEPIKVTAGIYTLIDNPTKYQSKVFNELKLLLEKETYSDEDIAKSITKNFIAEFYTLSNVKSKDVRGTQFVPIELRDRFKEFGSDIYDYYVYYINRADLEVVKANITKVQTTKYNYIDELKVIASKKDLAGYIMSVNWSYKNNKSYLTNITIVKWDDNYYIVKVDNSKNK